ncbi:hypothetical protein [Spirosoma foliorum]|uniref:Uncharacterized protein n=1 Tax=Spirosoma foliorum TaxID=2710596 RepID=A0A7G5H4X9_9BACT|nr:hypothetical protein [Spirosoma foliorum]QMW06171.1 hypothetical protein H3H32_15405 [Spirosoma foliorum]
MIKLFSLYCLIALAILTSGRSFAQTKTLAAKENELVSLYAKLKGDPDQIDKNATRFANELAAVLKANPATLTYPFKKLTDKIFCFTQTSADGKFRVYSWDTESGGTMHFFNQIYQWSDNSKVFTKVLKYSEEEGGDAGYFCSKIYTVTIKNKNYYLVISNGVYSTKDASQSISVFTIDNEKLNDTVELFKTKTSTLNRIDVGFDFFSVVDRPERPLELITYDDKRKIVYIPVVDDQGKVSKRNILYQLKGSYFEFIGIETGKRN